MYYLPARNKTILIKKIQQYKRLHFPGKGSGARFAEEIGVAPQTLSNWLNGSRTPTFMQLYRLAKTFNVSPLELCGIRERQPSAQKITDVSLLDDLLKVLENAVGHGVDPRVTVKTMTLIKDIVDKEIEGMKSS